MEFSTPAVDHPDPQRPDDPAAWPTGRLLSTAARLVTHEWESQLAAHDLSQAGFYVLHLIGEHPMTQRELASHLHVEDQTMSRTVERLERSGYVVRRRDRADRRRLIVARTEQGQSAWQHAGDLAVAEQAVLAGVPDPAAFRRALVQIVQRLGGERFVGRTSGHSTGSPDPDDPVHPGA